MDGPTRRLVLDAAERIGDMLTVLALAEEEVDQFPAWTPPPAVEPVIPRINQVEAWLAMKGVGLGK